MSLTSLRLVNGQSVTAYGAGRTLELCMNTYGLRLTRLIDSNRRIVGTTKYGVQIEPPGALDPRSHDGSLIVVFSAQYWDIAQMLMSRGFSEGDDFVQFTDLGDMWKELVNIPTDFWFHQFPKLIGYGYNCLDIGANAGIYSIQLSLALRAHGAVGSVTAFEPLSRTARLTRANLAKFGFTDVNVVQKAVVDDSSRGRVEMLIPKKNGVAKGGSAHIRTVQIQDEADVNRVASWSSDLGPEWSTSDFHSGITETVATTTLDLWVARFAESIDFIKLDVEGFETSVLRGAAHTLARDLPGVLAEDSISVTKAEGESVRRILADLGYLEVSIQSFMLEAAEKFHLPVKMPKSPNRLFWHPSRPKPWLI